MRKNFPDLETPSRAAAILNEGRSMSTVAFVYQVH